MAINVSSLGVPGVGPVKTVVFGQISTDGVITYKPGGGLVNGAFSRDSGNTDDTRLLRAGLIMAKNTTTGLYAPWAVGVTSTAITGGSSTSVTVSVAQALELLRAVGNSGTFVLTGPPTTNGVVAQETVTYSNVNTSTGVITITAPTASFVAGSILSFADWSTPFTFIGDGDSAGLYVSQLSANTEWDKIPAACFVNQSKLINFPSNANLANWIREAMSTTDGNKFIFQQVI